jgi:hypothetical protein
LHRPVPAASCFPPLGGIAVIADNTRRRSQAASGSKSSGTTDPTNHDSEQYGRNCRRPPVWREDRAQRGDVDTAFARGGNHEAANIMSRCWRSVHGTVGRRGRVSRWQSDSMAPTQVLRPYRHRLKELGIARRRM